MKIQRRRHWHLRASFLIAFLLVISPLVPTITKAQGPNSPDSPATEATEENDPIRALSQILRLERIEVPGGAELITVHAKLAGFESTESDNWVPLVSILRDTLGDNIAENNRLRYVWPLTYTRPTTKQRLAAAIPFFYARVGNKEKLSKVPPAAMDLASPESQVWDKIF